MRVAYENPLHCSLSHRPTYEHNFYNNYSVTCLTILHSNLYRLLVRTHEAIPYIFLLGIEIIHDYYYHNHNVIVIPSSSFVRVYSQ